MLIILLIALKWMIRVTEGKAKARADGLAKISFEKASFKFF